MAGPNITVRARLSAAAIHQIRAGLRRVLLGHEQRQNRVGGIYSHHEAPNPSAQDSQSEDDLEMIASVSGAVEELVSEKDSAKRVHLDAFQLAACSLGVRVTLKLVRHRHIRGWLPDHKASSRRLLRKLERLRKRAKRAFIRIHGQAAFAEHSRRWQQFVRFTRAELLSCSCGRSILKGPGIRARRRKTVEVWMERCRQDLSAAGLAVPPEKELLDLVNRALRSGDRLMRRLGWRNVHKKPGLLGDRIWNFVMSRGSPAREVDREEPVPSRHASREPAKARREAMSASEKDKELKGKVAGGEGFSVPILQSGAESGINRPSHREVTNEPPDVPAGHAASVVAICVKVSDDLRPLDIGIEAEVAQLQSDWPGLSALDRGLRLRELIGAGQSRRALANAVGCSEGLIRQLLRLTALTGDEKQAIQEEKLSCRQALKITSVRRVREQQVRLASDQQERAKHIDVLLAAALEWIQSLGLSASYREQFIDELRWGPYGARWWDLRHEAPQVCQIPVGRNPQDVIRRTRPEGPDPDYGPDWMNYHFTWYARWSQRLMPDTELRDTVMQRVSQKFR